MCRAVDADVDAVLEVVAQAGVRPRDVSILILSTTSDLHLKYKLGRTLLKRDGHDEAAWLATPVTWYRDANIRLITGAIRYAKSRGIERIEFAAEDASRSDLAYTIGSYASVAAPGKPVGYYLRVWRNEGGRWRVAMDVANPAPS